MIFVHANSFKLIEENQTLGSGEIFSLKYYMEILELEFSAAGVSIEISLNELVTQEACAQFYTVYNIIWIKL